MPRPTLLQSLLQQPTTKYSQDYNYASPATSLARRTRASASDAGSVYSLDSDNGSLYSGSPSIKSSKSLGASPQGRRGKRKTSRSYGNYLAEDPYSKPIRRAPSVQSSADSARTRRRSQVSVRDMDVGYQPPVKELPETPPPDQQTHEESFASPRPQQGSPQTKTSSISSASPSRTPDLSSAPSRSYLHYDSAHPTEAGSNSVRSLSPPIAAPPLPPTLMPAAHEAFHQPQYIEKQQFSPPNHSTSLQLEPEPLWNGPTMRSNRLSLVAEEPEITTPPADTENITTIFSSPSPPSTTRLPILSPLAPRVNNTFVLASFELVLPALHLAGHVKTSETVLSVDIRLTTDNWNSQADLSARVTHNSTGGFDFETGVLPGQIGTSIQCAVKMYHSTLEQWDSNDGNNFSFLLPDAGSSSGQSMPPSAEPSKRSSMSQRTDTGSLSQRSSASNYFTPEGSSDPGTSISSPPSSELQIAPAFNPPSKPSEPVADSLPHSVSAPRIFLSRSESHIGSLQEVYPEGSPPLQRTAAPFAQDQSSMQNQSTYFAAPIARQPSPSGGLSRRTVSNLERKLQAEQDMQQQQAPSLSRSASTSSSSHRSSTQDIGMNRYWPVGEAMPAPALPDFTPPSSHLGHHHPNGIDRNSPRLSMRVSPEELYASGLAASPPPVKPASRHNSVSRSSSRSVRKSLAKSEWTPDALWNKNSSMCALAISRVSNTNHNSFDAAERISFSPPSSPTKLFKRKKRQDAEREPVKQWSAYKVSFTSAAELPAKIKPGEVLVHVLATALDFWDQARVRELGRRSDGLGFVPGRSFYGKVLQVGADCKLHAGQFVYGLCPVARSGALAELMIVDKSSVCLAPTCNPGLTTEQLAALPITGIPAMATVWPLANSLPRGARILILDAATGVGHVALQLFRSLRLANELYIAVQVEPSTLDAQTICEGLGANDVFRDEPLESFLRLNDSSFDVVIDCIGGKRIHEAARRILRSEGTFATLVGDELSPDSAKKAFATSLRSLRSAFKKRDNKAVHYWMPMLSETDHREWLEILGEQVQTKGVLPHIQKVYRFEHGAEAFNIQQRMAGSHVIRLVES